MKTVLPWRVDQAQEQYRSRLISGLSSDVSIMRQHLLELDGIDENVLIRLIDEIALVDLREDSALDGILVGVSANASEILTKFAGTAYHMVGTSVVNCETGLDVSELADRRLGIMSGSEVYSDTALLTDVNVFIGCCFEMAMQAINETAFPIHVIDALPFDVIGKMRGRLQEQGFQQAYDEVISTFTSRLKPGRIENS